MNADEKSTAKIRLQRASNRMEGDANDNKWEIPFLE
jgi:hypothetical protein